MSRNTLEAKIQRKVVEFLAVRAWHVERMSANCWETGIPYLYCHSTRFGVRWVEVKKPSGFEFTPIQRRKWPELEQAGVGIWVLTAATVEQYGLLYRQPNWREFCKPLLASPARKTMFSELARPASMTDHVDERAATHDEADEPEEAIQAKLIEFLRARGWHVERMSANCWQNGIPDLYCYNREVGERWIEVKRPVKYSFTKYQRQKWPKWEKAGIGIWILTAATQEQYRLLFKPANWRDYWRESFAIPNGNAMFDELAEQYRLQKAGEEP